MSFEKKRNNIIDSLINSLEDIKLKHFDENLVKTIASSKNLNISNEEATTIINQFNNIFLNIPDLSTIKSKKDIVTKMQELGIDKSLQPIALKLLIKSKKIREQQGKQEGKQQEGNVVSDEKKKESTKKKIDDEIKRIKQQLLKEGDAAHKKQQAQLKINRQREGYIDEIAERWDIEDSETLSNIPWSSLKLPQVYRFWDLGSNDANTGIWPGRILWVNKNETMYGDNNYRFGILWADGYYSEEELDYDIFWFTDPKDQIDFHIDGEEKIPKWILDKIEVSLFSHTPEDVKLLYKELISNPPKHRVLTPLILKKFKSRLLTGLIDTQRKKILQQMRNAFQNKKPFNFNVNESTVALNFERINGDGRCMYRGQATGLNYLCTGNGRGEGQIDWDVTNHSGSPPNEETGLAELIMLSSILAIENNLFHQPFAGRYQDPTDIVDEQFEASTYFEIIEQERPKNYVEKMLNIPSTSTLGYDFWGSDMEQNAFVNFVMPELRISTFNEVSLDTLTTATVIQSTENNNENPPTIYLLFTGGHFNALYNENRMQQRAGFNMTRSQLIARLLNYIYDRMIDTNRRDLFKKKIQFILSKFANEEVTEIITDWKTLNAETGNGDKWNSIVELLQEMADERRTETADVSLKKRKKEGGGKKTQFYSKNSRKNNKQKTCVCCD